MPPCEPRRNDGVLCEIPPERVMARDLGREVAEHEPHIADVNGDTSLGILFTEAVG